MIVVAAEFGASWGAMGKAAVSAAAILATVITYTRLAGLRSFSKMSSFDFAMTVAVGSAMATVALGGSSLVIGVAALGTFYAVQVVIALLRRHVGFSAVVDNTPMVLMVGDRYLDDNLDRSRVTRADVNAKLREANVYNYDDLRAVILETTGDISVIHGDRPLDPRIFDGVRDADHLAEQPRSD